ncbi:uncharacterized protein LOC120068574 [Benincasa hispida]|uniref:uncharacterized protein LOC120068574 n=1 Tax=Benincasa hispida TaxID=102211 RepID=UPI001900BF6B|nr:uncharacterized protein LOC120068574 [Benincasa hispida]
MTRSPIPSRDPDTNNATASDTPIPPLQPDTTMTSPIDVEPIEADVPQTELDMSALLTMPHTYADMSSIPKANIFGIVTITEEVTLESRRISCKRKPVDKYTPSTQVKKKSVVKHPLSGVAMSLSRAIVTYNVAHDVPHNILTEMMGWISDDNTVNKV